MEFTLALEFTFSSQHCGRTLNPRADGSMSLEYTNVKRDFPLGKSL